MKEIILSRADSNTSLSYVSMILVKVFDCPSVDQANQLAMSIDRHKNAVVYTGSEEQVQEKINLLNSYNESFKQTLPIDVQNAGTLPSPPAQHTT